LGDLRGLTQEELEKLDKMMLVVAAVGMVVNVTQLFAMNNHAWIKATALHDGQPFTAHLSLDSVNFGAADDSPQGSEAFCGDRYKCRLHELCKQPFQPERFQPGRPGELGMLRNTPSEAWCGFDAAGDLTARLLSFGFLLGLVATGLTAMYASQSIPWVALQFDKIEDMGFTDRIQKYIMCGCWVALWFFVFSSMATYALLIPDTLGWGAVELEASFGLLRLCFVLCTINGALMVNSLEDLWDTKHAKDVWKDFVATKLFSSRKLLYVLLFTQMLCYLLMVVTTVDWSGLLIVLAALYLIANDRTFMFFYMVLVTISIIFDSLTFAELPAFENMTNGEQYGSTLWITILVLKLMILVTILVKERGEAKKRQAEGREWTMFDSTEGRRTNMGKFDEFLDGERGRVAE